MEKTKQIHYHVAPSSELTDRLETLKLRLNALNMVYLGACQEAISCVNICKGFISSNHDIYPSTLHTMDNCFAEIHTVVYGYAPTSDLPLMVDTLRDDYYKHVTGDVHHPLTDYPTNEAIDAAKKITMSINRFPYVLKDTEGREGLVTDHVHVNIARFLERIPQEMWP